MVCEEDVGETTARRLHVMPMSQQDVPLFLVGDGCGGTGGSIAAAAAAPA
jgi:hypothetical protein